MIHLLLTCFLTAFINNPKTKTHNSGEEVRAEVTVIDPRHPLFNRTFPILSMSNHHFSQGHVYVIYREGVTLRIPLSATNITGNPSSALAKLTKASLEDLVSLAEEYNMLCPITLKKSGKDYQQMNNRKLSSN